MEVIVEIDTETYDEAVDMANENLCYVVDQDDNNEHSVVGVDDMKFILDEEMDYKWAEKV